MPVPTVTPNPTTKRLLILQYILDVLRTVRSGSSVTLSNGATYTYTQSVGLVSSAFIDITELADQEFPAVFVIPDDVTSFSNDADGYTADATWTLSLVLNVKGNTGDTVRDQGPLALTVELVELLLQDVMIALLTSPFMLQPCDTVVSFDRLTPNPYVDPGFAQSILDVQIHYTHNFFQ